MTSSSFVSALDSKSPFKLGENNNFQYNWSENIKEKILQLSFQINETTIKDEANYNKLNTIYYELIEECFVRENYHMLNILYKLIANTRDIISGKGIYSISYSFICQWAIFGFNVQKHKSICIELVKNAIYNFVYSDNNKIHPLGSWKDIKYFSNVWNTTYRQYDYDNDIMNYYLYSSFRSTKL